MGRRTRPLLNLEDAEPNTAYSVPDVAHALDYARPYIRRLIRDGRIKAFKPGGHEYRVRGDEIMHIAETLKGTGLPPPKPPPEVVGIEVTPEQMDKIKPGWRSLTTL